MEVAEPRVSPKFMYLQTSEECGRADKVALDGCLSCPACFECFEVADLGATEYGLGINFWVSSATGDTREREGGYRQKGTCKRCHCGREDEAGVLKLF